MLLLVTLHTDALHIIFTLIFGIFNPILTIRMCVNVRMFLLVPAHPGSPGQGADKRLCVCVCVCVCVFDMLYSNCLLFGNWHQISNQFKGNEKFCDECRQCEASA